MYSHLLRMHPIDLKVESMCALVCCVLSFDFLKKKLEEKKNALMWLLDRLDVTAVIVLIIQLLFVQITTSARSRPRWTSNLSVLISVVTQGEPL